MNNDAANCQKCGARLVSGDCPACLLRMGLDRDSHQTKTHWEPPAPADLSARLDDIEVHELVGQGGMGAVYRAKQLKLDRTVALKVLRPGLIDPSFAERFELEAKTLAKLNHPNIVTVHDYGRAGEFYYLVLEWVAGSDLRKLLADGPLAAARAVKIAGAVCAALAEAHRLGVIHRDIKPENVLISDDGDIKLTDFGIAKITDTEQVIALTETAQGVGTPNYMAPEQVHGEGVDERTDVYAVGVVLYELLTGDLPIGRFAPPSRKVKSTDELDRIVMRALSEGPDARFQSARQLADALSVPSVVSPQRLRRAAELRPAPGRKWYLAALALSIVGSAVTMWFGFSRMIGKIENMARVVMPGAARIELDAGSYTGFLETRSIVGEEHFWLQKNLDGMRCYLRSAETQEWVVLRGPETSTSYATGSYAGQSAFEMDVPQAGAYDFECNSESAPDSPHFVMALGQGMGGTIVSMVVPTLLCFFGGIAWFIVVFVKRRRRRREFA